MIIKEEVKLGEISKLIADLVDKGELTEGMGVALKSVVSSVFRTIYGVGWREVIVTGLDVEEVFEDFVRKKAEKGSAMHAKGVYYARFRRAMNLYNQSLSSQKGRTAGGIENDEVLKKLMESINVIQAILSPDLIKRILRAECVEDYDVYAVPVRAGKVGALVLPKDLTIEDIDKVDSLLEGVFICSKAKKGGKM